MPLNFRALSSFGFSIALLLLDFLKADLRNTCVRREVFHSTSRTVWIQSMTPINFDSHQCSNNRRFGFAHPLNATDNGWLLGKDRWGLSSPYHMATTYPCKQPGLPPALVRVTGGTCHADWTLRCVCHPPLIRVVAHTQIRSRRLLTACHLCGHPLGG